MGYLVHPPDAPVALRDRMFALLGGAVAWLLHLSIGYLLIALGCNTGAHIVRPGVIILTVACLALALTAGVVGMRRWRQVQEWRGWEYALDESGGGQGLLLLVGVASAALFTVLILLNAISPFLVQECAP